MRWLILIFLILPIAAQATTDSLGNPVTSCIVQINIEDIIWMYRDSMVENGCTDSLYIYNYNSNATCHLARGGIYAVANGDTTLIDTTNEIDLCNTSAQWTAFYFIENAQLYADSIYFLAIWGEAAGGNALVCRQANAAYHESYQKSAAYGTWPNPMTAPTFSDLYRFSIYIVYNEGDCPAAGPTGPPNYRYGPGQLGVRHSPSGNTVRSKP